MKLIENKKYKGKGKQKKKRKNVVWYRKIKNNIAWTLGEQPKVYHRWVLCE